MAAKLATALQPAFAMSGGEASVAVACGVVHYPADGRDALTLLRRASGLAASKQAIGGTQRASDAAND